MSTLLIRNAAIAHLDRQYTGRAVLCRDGRIAAVVRDAEAGGLSADDCVDAGGALLAPGLIDLHIHGAGPCLIDEGPEHLADLCRMLPRFGVTGFLPSVCPRPKGEDARFLRSLAGARTEGAQILGFHLEGPFLTLTGALPPEALGTVDPPRVRALMEAALPHPAVFSVSPDFNGLLDLLPIMRAGGAPVFMTHTRASVAQTRAAVDAGVRHATHFYDVFPLPPEGEPGVRPVGAVEVALADPRVTVDFILDGEHVDPTAVEMALRCKGPDGVCLITDANIGAGLAPGRFRFVGGDEVESRYPGGPARRVRDGALAGSGLTMDQAVRNAVRMLGLAPAQAIRLAGTNPARVLGLGDRKGRIEPGYDADMVLLDGALAVQRTWIGGRTVYARPPAP